MAGGANELDRGTIHNALLLCGPESELALHHRKLVPTNHERHVWSQGGGAGLEAVMHGTTRCRPAEPFAAEEAPRLKPLPDDVFHIPTRSHPKVAPDRHAQIAKALYSVRGELVGCRPGVAPSHRQTDPADLPAELTVYAMRDLNTLQRKASADGDHVGAYAGAVLEHPVPWTKMRQVSRLLGVVRRHGADAVDDACRRALDAEVVDVGVIERMLTPRRTGEQFPLIPTQPTASRFVRATTDFAVRRPS